MRDRIVAGDELMEREVNENINYYILFEVHERSVHEEHSVAFLR